MSVVIFQTFASFLPPGINGYQIMSLLILKISYKYKFHIILQKKTTRATSAFMICDDCCLVFGSETSVYHTLWILREQDTA